MSFGPCIGLGSCFMDQMKVQCLMSSGPEGGPSFGCCLYLTKVHDFKALEQMKIYFTILSRLDGGLGFKNFRPDEGPVFTCHLDSGGSRLEHH